MIKRKHDKKFSAGVCWDEHQKRSLTLNNEAIAAELAKYIREMATMASQDGQLLDWSTLEVIHREPMFYEGVILQVKSREFNP